MKPNTAYYCIKEPYWKIKGFGLAKKNMGKRKTIISVSLKNKNGEFTFQNDFVITTKDALEHTLGKAGITREPVHEIPFADCKEIPRKRGAR